MADRDPDCLFCKIVGGEIPGTIVAEDERTVAFMDINPATRGHALVVPRAHATDLLERARRGPRRLRRRGQAPRRARQGARSAPTASTCSTSCGAAAWQTVFHFHMHVIPRYDDDPLRLPWTPGAGRQRRDRRRRRGAAA